jgi:hypothetical protein
MLIPVYSFVFLSDDGRPAMMDISCLMDGRGGMLE